MQNENNHIIIYGDANINLLNGENNIYSAADYLDMFMSNGFIPTITKPTRVTIHSATLIDHIFLKYNPQSTHFAGSIITDISDHYPNFIFINTNSDDQRYGHKLMKRRNFNQSCIDNFNNNSLFTTKWADLVNSECPNETYPLFINKFISLLDKHIPEQISKPNKYKHKKHPWITQAILKSIRTRDHLSKKRIHSKATADFNNIDQQYKQYRNLLTRVIRNAKSQYWNTTLNLHNLKIT